MKNFHIFALVIVAIFATWFVTRGIYTKRAVEFFTTNLNLEDRIKGYKFTFGDQRSDTDAYFGFADDIQSGFSKRLLPITIPVDK